MIMLTTRRRRTLRQWLTKNWRDVRVLLRAFSRPLLLFLGTLITTGMLYWFGVPLISAMC